MDNKKDNEKDINENISVACLSGHCERVKAKK
jgi:hypothetical protein